MSKIPQELRQNIARNIRECRTRKFPGRGGARLCAEAFGVLPQQWSPWETGKRVPDESRLVRLAEFFGVTVEFLRRDNALGGACPSEKRIPGFFLDETANSLDPRRPMPAQPGSSESFYHLLEWFLSTLIAKGLTINLVNAGEPQKEAPRRHPVEVPD